MDVLPYAVAGWPGEGNNDPSNITEFGSTVGRGCPSLYRSIK